MKFFFFFFWNEVFKDKKFPAFHSSGARQTKGNSLTAILKQSGDKTWRPTKCDIWKGWKRSPLEIGSSSVSSLLSLHCPKHCLAPRRHIVCTCWMNKGSWKQNKTSLALGPQEGHMHSGQMLPSCAPFYLMTWDLWLFLALVMLQKHVFESLSVIVLRLI